MILIGMRENKLVTVCEEASCPNIGECFGKGDGSRVIAVFEDPNCGYCKQFRKTTLNEIDNVTVYTFLYNILREDSFTKSAGVWCASDRNKAWDDWMLNGKQPPAAPASCATPNQEIVALGRKIGVSGTPTIIFTIFFPERNPFKLRGI